MKSRVTSALGLCVALLALAPASAGAAQRVTAVRGFLSDAPQLVGSKVAWQERACLTSCGDVDCGPGGARFRYAMRLGTAGRAARTLFSKQLRCAESGPNFFVESASAQLSATRLALVERTSRGDEVTGDSVTAGLSAGPAAGGPRAGLYSCSTGGSSTFGSFEFALDGDALAYDADACGDSRHWLVKELSTGTEHAVPQPALSSLYSPRLGGRYFAFLRSPFTLVVWDWVAGAEAYSVVLPQTQYPQSLDVDTDGKVALLTRNPDEGTNTCTSERVSWLSPAEPRLHELPALPCQTAVRIGANRVLFEAGPARRRSLQAVGLSGGSPRAVARFGAVRDAGFDSDGGRAAFALRTCGGRQAIYSLALSEKTFSAGSERCPVAISSTRLRSSHGATKVTLNCPRACTGVVRLSRGKTRLATKTFGSERRGKKVLPLKLTPSARALLRRHGSIAVKVSVTVTDRDLRTRTVRRSARLR